MKIDELAGLWSLPGCKDDFLHRVVVVHTGPFSSHHDRACELFYKLKGGRVDYGEIHAEKCHHARFGKRHRALIPQWGETYPIHLVAHSTGSLKLQPFRTDTLQEPVQF